MKLKITENDFNRVYLDEELIWSDEWSIDCPEDLVWNRIIQPLFEAARKLGFEEGKRAYQYPRDALDL